MSAVALFMPPAHGARLGALSFRPGRLPRRPRLVEPRPNLHELDRVRVMSEVQTDLGRIPAMATGTIMLLDDGAAHALVEVTQPVHIVASLPVRLLHPAG